jgi:hypothetical protein
LLYCLKFRFDAKLIYALNYTAQIVAEDFTKGFVSLGNRSLALDALSEFRFNHAECGFTVAALVIVPHVLFLMKAILMKHLVPNFAL